MRGELLCGGCHHYEEPYACKRCRELLQQHLNHVEACRHGEWKSCRNYTPRANGKDYVSRRSIADD